MIKKIAFNVLGAPFDTIDVQDHHTGYAYVPLNMTVVIEEYKYMLVPNGFYVDGSLVIDGEIIVSGDF